MHYGEEAEAVKAYLNRGLQRALELDNRGPIRFDADGKLSKDILEAYSRYGFYVFESAISQRSWSTFRQIWMTCATDSRLHEVRM